MKTDDHRITMTGLMSYERGIAHELALNGLGDISIGRASRQLSEYVRGSNSYQIVIS